MRRSALYLFGLVVAVLVALGLIVLASASEVNSARWHHGDIYHFLKFQATFVVVGIAFAYCVARFDYHHWRDHEGLAWFFFVGVLVALVFAFTSKAVNGSHRWIRFGALSLQPSEFAKLALVIILSVWLDKVGWKVELPKLGAWYPFCLIALTAGLIVIEPDYGSVMVVCLVGFLLMFVAGTRFWHMVPLALGSVAVLAVLVFTNQNRVARMFDESRQHQVKMALTAIANSDIWGAGLGESMQKHYYLPEAHTDFVFAVGAEELGILFSIAVVVFYLLFFLLSVYIARKASDRFGRFLVVGMASILFFEAMFNIGVVCGAYVTKGMALPFFSYGGTNLLSSFFIVGTILSVGINSCRERSRSLMRKVIIRRG